MSATLTYSDKINLRAKAKSINVNTANWRDEDYENFRDTLIQQSNNTAQQNIQTDPKPLVQTVPEGEVDTRGPGGTFIENMWDAVRGGTWSLFDTALFSAPGAIYNKIDPKSYNEMLGEMQDTLGGRIGSTVGGLAGFMAPLGIVGKGTNLAVRTVRGIKQAKALERGEKVVNATTRTLQRQGANKIRKSVLRNAENQGISKADALKMSHELSDEVMGFAWKPGWKNVFGLSKGPAYHLEHSMQQVEILKGTLRANLPQKLAQTLSSAGKNLTNSQIGKLSDDLIEIYATQPANGIWGAMAKKGGSKATNMLSRLTGSMVQEAVDFGIVGTIMDGIQYASGNLDTDEKSFLGRVGNHFGMGLAFGFVKFVPGGTNVRYWDTLKKSTQRNYSRINNKIKDMSLEEAKHWALADMKINKSYVLNVNGVNITERMLRPGVQGIKESMLRPMKKQMILQNNKLAKEFAGPGWKHIAMEMGKDFKNSLARMAVGSMAFNFEAVRDGHFDHMGEAETLFHWGLGALMTKKGVPLHKSAPGVGSLHFGERPYYYSAEMNRLYKIMESQGYRNTKIGEIGRHYTGSIQDDWMERNHMEDVDNIIEILKSKDIIYNATETGGELRPSDIGPRSEPSDELALFLQPIASILRTRNYRINPNFERPEADAAVSQIKNLESNSLSTSEAPVHLTSGRVLKKAMLAGSKESGRRLLADMFDSYSSQFEVLTGKKANEEGKIKKINVDLDKFEDGTIIESDERVVMRKFLDLQENLANKAIDYIRFEDIQYDNQAGIEYKLTQEKVENIRDNQFAFEKSLERELYGDIVEPVDMNDPGLWNLLKEIEYSRNIEDVFSVMNGVEVNGVNKALSNSIKSGIHEILSPPNNRATNLIVDNPDKIKINFEGFEGDASERNALENFVTQTWAITATQKNMDTSFREFEVPWEKVFSLKESLVQAGMPDPVMNQLEWRMEDWYNRAMNHGINERLGLMDPTPYKRTVIKRGILNGWIQASGTAKDNQVVRLAMPRELSKEMVKRINKELNDTEVESYVKAYKVVQKELSGILDEVDVSLEGLTHSQLSNIKTAEHILKHKKFEAEVDEVNMTIIDGINRAKERFTLLEDPEAEIPGIGKVSELEQIETLMEGQKELIKGYNRLHEYFTSSFGGGREMGRVSAFLDFFKTKKGIDGESSILKMLEDAARMKDLTPDKFNKISEQIENIQVEIGRDIARKPDISTQFHEMRIDAIEGRRQNEEIEGFMPGNSNIISPEKYIKKYNISVDDARHGYEASATTPDSASDLIWDIYKHFVIDGKGTYRTRDSKGNSIDSKGEDAFIDKMLDLAKTTRTDASDIVRDEVAKLAKLMSRRFKVKKLSLNLDSGKGTFENSEISEGFLTDTWLEVIGNSDMIMLDGSFLQGNKLSSLTNRPEEYLSFQKILRNEDFYATVGEGFSKHEKLLKNGRISELDTDVAETPVVVEGVTINDKYIKGKNWILGIDENIDLVVNQKDLQGLGRSFKKFYEELIKSDYVKNLTDKNAKRFVHRTLKDYYDRIVDSEIKGPVNMGLLDFDNFAKDKVSDRQKNEYIEDAIHAMFSSQYASRINSDWIMDVYESSAKAKKYFKYLRLAQNLGYTRNADVMRRFTKQLWMDSNNDRAKELIEKFDGVEEAEAFVIEDGKNSESGSKVLDLLTDNRSIAEDKINKMLDRGDIRKEDSDFMINELTKSHYINAEAVNGQTIVSRDFLDYLMLINGDNALIGETAGQKPVGLTSFEEDGVRHVFYNKTHYFYDSRLDPFFAANKNTHMIAFTSGAKKAKKIDTNNKNKDIFKAYDDIPKASEMIDVDGKERTNSIASWLNGLDVKNSPEATMRVKINQTLSGVNYDKSHDVKISKQFENYGSPEAQASLYRWARQDMAQRLGEVTLKFYDPSDTRAASQEAKTFLNDSGSRESDFESEIDNMSTASIWIENDGVPFSAISGNAYDTFIKNRYIKDVGVFDGYTDGGGSAILRGNNANNLDIPIFNSDGIQVKIGEANVGSEYLDRKINFLSKFDVTASSEYPGMVKRRKYQEESTLTVAYKVKPGDIGAKARDIIIDMVTKEIYDPLNPDAKIAQKEYKNVKKMYDRLYKKLSSGKLKTYRNVFQELRYKKYDKLMSLYIDATPQPRTGPHDVVGLKVRGLLNRNDGGLLEMNVYDLTSRSQRDFDTDKIYFFMDTPFGLSKEAYKRNGTIREPAPPGNKDLYADFDPYNRASFSEYKRKVNEFKRFRGPVIKMHRKITYAENLFSLLPKGIDLGDGQRLVFNKNSTNAKQRLVTDSQDILDIYDGIPKFFTNVDSWNDATLFGNSRTHPSKWSKDDKPFFLIEDKDGNQLAVTDKGHQLIIKKLLNDYSSLLNLEGNIWESGQSKDPRYADMIQNTLDFKDKYDTKTVNYSFYNYLVYKGEKPIADKIFYGSSAPEKKEDMIRDVITPIAGEIFNNGGATTFLKSLLEVTKKDHLNPIKIHRPGGDIFNEGIMKWVGAKRDEALKVFMLAEEGVSSYTDAKGNLIEHGSIEHIKAENALHNELWESVQRKDKDEGFMVQIAALEQDIQRAEYIISEKQKKQFVDEESVQLDIENVALKKEAQDVLLRKMSIWRDPKDSSKGLGRQKLYSPRETKEITARGYTVIRDNKTGKKIKDLRDGETWTLNKDHVAITNPVKLRAVTEHDLIDGIAWMYSTAGYRSGIKEESNPSDFQQFEKILKRTSTNIKGIYSTNIKKKGVTDWSRINALTLKSVENGIKNVVEMAWGMEIPLDIKEGDMGIKFPEGKETYALDFLMSLLRTDETGNPYEYSYSGSTGGLHPSVKAPSKAVISSVMHALDAYGVRPHNMSRKQFIGQLAKTHRAFYDAVVGGEGFHRALNTLAETNIEGALLNHLSRKVVISPFMSSKEFKTMRQEMELNLPVQSDWAEIFRQLFQDGAIIDPVTFLKLRDNLIRDHGKDAYDTMMKTSRGHLLYDGLMTNSYGFGREVGQVIGHKLYPSRFSGDNRTTGEIRGKPGAAIRNKNKQVVGDINTLDCNK